MQQKRDGLAEELEQDKLQSPEEQRKRLLNSVKEDNQEIAGMESKVRCHDARLASTARSVSKPPRRCQLCFLLFASVVNVSLIVSTRYTDATSCACVTFIGQEDGD